MAGASASLNRSESTAISTPARSCWSSITERELRPPTRERFRHLSEREIAHAHGHAELAAKRVGERNVLVGEPERERRRIVLARQELVYQRIERITAPSRALADRLPQRERLDARLHTHGEGFGKHTDDCIAGHIMD